ncbi:MAG: hypothetical protein FWD79_08345 [Desulfobulbus sp.]|nr:hypothetical protein [Desulfobulbus sp.]
MNNFLSSWSVFLLACLLCTGAQIADVRSGMASDVYIKTDNNETGQGVFRQRGEECLCITPLHVVDSALHIDVTLADKREYAAEMIESFPGDIGVLRIMSTDPIPCKAGAYFANIPLDTLLTAEKSGELRTMLADGSIRITPVNIVGYDQFRTIRVAPQDAGTSFAKGESGSPLYIAGRFAGMLLSVTNNVGQVVRSDALAQTVALFFGDKALNAPPAVAPKKSDAPMAEKARRREMAGKEQEFSGVIAKSAVAEHSIKLEENSPIRLSFLPTGDSEQFNLEILDSARRIVFQNKKRSLNGTEATSIPFTPPRSGVYSMFIIGTKGEGKYAFTVTPITTDAYLRSQTNAIHIGGGAVQGLIAQGAVAEYFTSLEENSPIRIVLPASEDRLRYSLDIVDADGKSVYRDAGKAYSAGDPVAIPFTPPKTGQYTICIKGAEGEGSYALQLLPIASNAQLRGEANILVVGGAQAEGHLAQGAVAEYRLQLESLQTVRFYFAGSGDSGKYTVEVVDSTDGPVYLNPSRRYDGTETFTIPFAAPKTDTYTLRLVGTDGECRYAISIRQGGVRQD